MEAIRVSEYGFNWIPILQTAIGTFGGFIFGLVAFGIQRQIQQNSDQDKISRTNIDTLKRLLQCAGANTDTIAMLRLQLLDDLAPEVEKMEGLVEQAYEDDSNVSKIFAAAGDLQHFYQTLPRAYELDPPTFSELSGVVDDMPGLTTFLHRGMSSISEFTAISDERNKLISEYAKENSQGLNNHRLRYFASMLTGQGRGMIEAADNAMGFFMLVTEQVEGYLEHGMGVEVNKYILSAAAIERLPDKDRFPALRKLLVDFREHPLGGKRRKGGRFPK